MSKDISQMAKTLGSLGGKARADSLTATQKKNIAALGAKARVISLQAAKRIRKNFLYLDAMQELRGDTVRVTRVSTCNQPLPDVFHAKR